MKRTVFCKWASISIAVVVLCWGTDPHASEVNIDTHYADSIRVFIAGQIQIQRELFKRRTPTEVDSSIAVMTSALHLAETTFGPNDTMVAHCLTQLGFSYYWSDKRSESLPLVKRAISTWINSGGSDHPKVGQCWRLLGDYYYSLGNPSEAEAAYQEGITVFERISPTAPEALTQFSYLLTNLAQVRMSTGAYNVAESLLVRGRELRVQAHGEESPGVKSISGLFASLYRGKRQYQKAEPFYREAVENQLQTYGPRDFRYAGVLSSFAYNQFLQNKYDEAAELNDQAVDIIVSEMGKYHSKAATILALQAKIEAQRGNLPRAIQMARDAYEGRTRSNFRYSPNVFFDQTRLARILIIADSLDAAVDVYSDMLLRKREFYTTVFRYTSEEQKIAYSNIATPIEPSLLSLAASGVDPRLTLLAYDMVLNGKSLVVDAIAAEREKAFCSEDSAFVALLNAYSDLCTRISNIFVGNQFDPGELTISQAVDDMFRTKDQMERDLSKMCSLYAEQSDLKSASVDDILAVLPDSTVLCEYVRFQPFDFSRFESKDDRFGEPQYVAFTLSKAKGLTVTELGETNSINGLVRQLQALMGEAPADFYTGNERESYDNVMAVSQQLYQLVAEPILKEHTSCKNLVVAPDGVLNLLPFNILADAHGRFLIENLSVSLVTSGRDILKWNKDTLKTDNRLATILVAPDYDRADTAGQQYLFAEYSVASSHSPVRSTLGDGACIASQYPPLPGSDAEGTALAALLHKYGYENIDLFRNSAANETNLKHLDYSPTVLHIATHSFFCDPRQEIRPKYNSLLFCGLVLAGANGITDATPGSTPPVDDGFLTALELSSLNLSETEIVVLSACESGLTEIRTGQGVFGLRRAIMLAGASAAVMSMYEVSDNAAQALMMDFYANWLNGMSKSEAIRTASLNRLRAERESGRSGHPLMWGGFVLFGNPN